jgi:SAM-dependent methyltransferase
MIVGTKNKLREQHNVEILENEEHWRKKKALRSAYGDFYDAIRQSMKPITQDGITVEIGSGIGSIKEFIPECVTTDMFPNPWIDRKEDVYELTFKNETVDNLLLFDVWHHLEYPALALRECRRVLRSDGRLIIFDPAMSATGLFVYGCFHHEPLLFRHRFNECLEPPEAEPSSRYFAAQSAAHRVFVKKQQPRLLQDWRVLSVTPITSFSYLASGGFRGRQLYPDAAITWMNAIDRLLARWPKLFAARLLIVLTPHD